MPNINVQAGYFLPIISDCTLIACKKSIRPSTYTELLLLLVKKVVVVVVSHIGPNLLYLHAIRSPNATDAMLHLLAG